jgi:putative flippase GtrA
VTSAGRPAPGAGSFVRRVLDNGVVRYLLVGGSAFLVDLGLLTVLHELLGWPVGLASPVAFVVSFVYTYSLQRIAFRSESPHGRALVRYLLLVGANTVATALIVAGVDMTAAGWVVGKVVSTGVTSVWNYFAYKHWVFRPAAVDGPAPSGRPESPPAS